MASEALLTEDALIQHSQTKKRVKTRTTMRIHIRESQRMTRLEVTTTILEGYPTRQCMCASKACLAAKGNFVSLSVNSRAEICLLRKHLSESDRDFRGTTIVKVQMSCRGLPFIMKNKATQQNQS